MSPVCSQPSASSASAVRYRVVEIAAEHDRAAAEHLAVFGGDDLDPGIGPADPAGLHQERLPGHATAVLAHAVDLAHRQPDVAQEVDHLRRHRCRATEDELGPVQSYRRAHRGERDLVDERPRLGQLAGRLLAAGPQLLHLPPDRQRVGEARRHLRDHARRPGPGCRPPASPRPVAGRTGSSAAPPPGSCPAGSCRGTARRSTREGCCCNSCTSARRCAPSGGRTPRVIWSSKAPAAVVLEARRRGEHVEVAEHHALGRSGGAGGVDDRQQVGGIQPGLGRVEVDRRTGEHLTPRRPCPAGRPRARRPTAGRGSHRPRRAPARRRRPRQRRPLPCCAAPDR